MKEVLVRKRGEKGELWGWDWNCLFAETSSNDREDEWASKAKKDRARHFGSHFRLPNLSLAKGT